MRSPADSSRRAFLLGRPAAAAPLRPPWALDEAEFLQRCTGCAACVDACPQRVLRPDVHGYPRFLPQQGECTFCADCATACEPGALDAARPQPWDYRARIDERCLARAGVVCQSCRDACASHAIRFVPTGTPTAPRLDLDRCSGCGACVSACPVDALALGRAAPP